MSVRACRNCGMLHRTSRAGSGRERCPACYQYLRRTGRENTGRRVLPVLLAWEAGQLSEGQAAVLLGLDRVGVRSLRLEYLDRASSLWGHLRPVPA